MASGGDHYAVAGSFDAEVIWVSRRTALALGAFALVLTACGSGKDAQVVREHTAINGVNVNLGGGTIQVRNVYATPADTALLTVPAGGALNFHFRVYNQGGAPELMVTNPPVTLSGTGVTAGAVTVPAGGGLWVGGPSGDLTATIPHVTSDVLVGTYVPLTLSFSDAGNVNITVPVEDGAVASS